MRINDGWQFIGHELQFAVDRYELPAIIDPHFCLFEAERVNARSDLVPLARREDVGQRNKVAAGIHTFSLEEAKMRIADGWQFIAVNSELKFMTDGAKQIVDGLGRGAGEVAKY